MGVFVIAEAGANHNRNYEQAIALIDAAATASADAVKFQTYSSNTLYSKNTPNFAGYEDINKLIKNIELPREWQKDLKQYCDKKNIEFMSTPFDEQAVEELCELGVRRLKIAGFESTDPRFVRTVATAGLPLIITAGIGSSIRAVENIISWVKEVNEELDITILHGNNAYPTPFADAALNQIDRLISTFPDIKIGLSDHTRGILAPPLAVAKGAVVIEKHFTLSRRLPGPDHPFAVEPHELEQMVKNIRTAEQMCDTRLEDFSASEEKMKTAMRSCITKKLLPAGSILTEENLTTKRPWLQGSIPAGDYYSVLGKKVLRDLEEDAILTIQDI
tara:strand:+ start:6005 stop:7000 length:996 start_codon:yes stop_codon:yes gene_type:complete